MIDHVDEQTNEVLKKEEIYIQYRKTTDDSSWDLHSHNGYEIYLFQKGNARYIIGTTVYSLKTGDMLVFKGSVLHHAKPSSSESYVRSFINFLPSYVATGLPSEIIDDIEEKANQEGGLHIHWSEALRPEVEKLYFQMFKERDTQSVGYREMMKASFLQLIIMIYRSLNSLSMINLKTNPSQKEVNVEQVLKIINERFRDQLSLNDMASEIHLSKHYMCHCFKEVTGFGISHYLARRRVDEAKKLLVSTNMSAVRISTEIGLTSNVQFSRLFKQHVGVSPKEFRRMYKINSPDV